MEIFIPAEETMRAKKAAAEKVKKNLDAVLKRLFEEIGWDAYKRLVIPIAEKIRNLKSFLRWALETLGEYVDEHTILTFKTV